ncbi:MAG TPA: hypothetical protein VGG72_11640 [Bryobacteraceae bacterium]|jgi:hypothetical protein
MAKSKKTSTRSFEFKTTTKVKVTFAELHLLPSLEYLDVEALSRAAKATIEVGFYKTSCCERYVRAVIEAGKVVRLDMDECKDMKPPHPELAALVKMALKRAGRRPAGKFKPMPVKAFLGQAKEIADEGEACFSLCGIFGCYYCCTRDGKTGKCTREVFYDLILDSPHPPGL